MLGLLANGSSAAIRRGFRGGEAMRRSVRGTTATGPANYRRGTLYAVATAVLLSLQPPFSAPAARNLSAMDFIGFTQCALLFSVPLLIARADTRRDFVAILVDVRNLPKLAAVFLVGSTGLVLFDIGLSSAHPIISAAVLNLTPFWAALVAFVVSRRSVAVSPAVFLGCFLVAFGGAMTIAWSQINADNKILAHAVIENAIHSKWIYALPAPIFFALNGTLVFKWFSEFDESAAIAANFVVSSLILIPLAVTTSNFGAQVSEQSALAILLLLFGALASSAAGRVFYQTALTATQNDNGYVTMFFLLTPVLTPLVCLPLSRWIPDLRFVAGPLFLIGLALVTVPLFLFSLIAWRGGKAPWASELPRTRGRIPAVAERDPPESRSATA
jgi:drug/metabolite transporter (DMT)-like permease